MTKRRKKNSKLVPFAIIGVASVVVVAGMFVVATNQQDSRTAPATESSNLSTSNGTFGDSGSDTRQIESFEEESEQRLAELREQESELGTIYEGTEETVYQGEGGDPALMNGEAGQFSDFDAAPEPAPSPEVPETVEAPTPDDVLTRSLMDEQATPASENISASRLLALEDRIASLTAEVQEMAADQPADQMLADTLLTPLREDLASLRQRITALSDRVSGLKDAEAEGQPDSEPRLEGLSQRFESFSEEMTARLEGLDERLEKVTASSDTPAKAPASAATPRRPAVSGLYELLAIESNVAVLKGQNTGRIYRIAKGGDLAYGGRLLDINGDQAVLAWPHRSVELSIYGQ